jgi:hypothetical protein
MSAGVSVADAVITSAHEMPTAHPGTCANSPIAEWRKPLREGPSRLLRKIHRRERGFPRQARPSIGVGCEDLRQDFQGDIALELRIARRLAVIDGSLSKTLNKTGVRLWT